MSDSDFDCDSVTESAWEDDLAFDQRERPDSSGRTEIFTLKRVADLQEDIAARVAEFIGAPPGACFQFLNSFKWHEEELNSQWLLDRQSVCSIDDLSVLARLHFVDLDMCPICCEDDLKGVHLGCGHAVCESCFRAYLGSKIEEFDIYNMRCPASVDCPLFVSRDVVRQTVDPFLWRNYAKIAAELYLSTAKSRIRGCPTPDCSFFVEIPGGVKDQEQRSLTGNIGNAAECYCGSVFCFACNQSHLPISCHLASIWNVLAADADLAWICQNTKRCPRCDIHIEKNKGCNHISCRCGAHFCWICLGDFNHLNYSHHCGVYDTKQESLSSNTDKIAKDRLLHYIPRVAANLASSSYHIQELVRLNNVLNNGKGDDDPLMEFSKEVRTEPGSLRHVHKTLADARNTVAWTFVLLCFTKTGNLRNMLESNVMNLQDAAEKLARLANFRFYKSYDMEAAKQKAEYIQARRKVLTDYVLSTEWEYEDSMQHYNVGDSF